jgi:hypothetical protein
MNTNYSYNGMNGRADIFIHSHHNTSFPSYYNQYEGDYFTAANLYAKYNIYSYLYGADKNLYQILWSSNNYIGLK